jgi:putative cardiolipin synthase
MNKAVVFSGLIRRVRSLAWVIGLAVALTGCATFPDHYQATPSQAFAQPEQTTLGKAFAAPQAQHPGLSGFRVINNGVSALMARAVLADLAERSIDIQYYIYDADETGNFLMERLLAAAKRGVRVRLLLDDYLLAIDDATLAKINAQPNMEVRLFNPYRDRARWSRSLQMLFNLDRLGRRMHNKVFAVDGQIGILGGRNVSNHYMEGEADANFRDIDLLTTGPILRDVEKSFDAFWNSDIVVPVAAFGIVPPSGDEINLSGAGRKESAGAVGPEVEYFSRKSSLVKSMLAAEGFIWAKGEAVAEPPVRQAEGAAKSSSAIARTLAIARQGAAKDVSYAVAYFVPGDAGVKMLGDMVARGVRVRVLTNSLASTDVIAVHAGYAKYREALLAAGVELYEYRIDAKRPEPLGHRLRLGSSGSALHAKVVIHDRRLVWVGSANFDPRSRRLNTEAGLLIDSEALADKLLSSMERDYALDQSWRLALEVDPVTEAKRMVWHGTEHGVPVRHFSDPEAGVLRHLGVGIYSILPGIEDLL